MIRRGGRPLAVASLSASVPSTASIAPRMLSIHPPSVASTTVSAGSTAWLTTSATNPSDAVASRSGSRACCSGSQCSVNPKR